MNKDLKQAGKGLIASIIFGILVLATTAATILKISDFPKATTIAPTDKLLLALASTNKYVQFIDLASQLHFVLDANGNVVSLSNMPAATITSLTLNSNLVITGSIISTNDNPTNLFQVEDMAGSIAMNLTTGKVLYVNGVLITSGGTNTGGTSVVTSTDGSVSVSSNNVSGTPTFDLGVSGLTLVATDTNGIAWYTNALGQVIASNSGPNFTLIVTNPPTRSGLLFRTNGNDLYIDVAWTNMLPLYSVPNIPTSSIPASSARVTNYVLINWTNTGPVFVATNTAASGSFLLTKPTWTTTTWP